MLFRVDKVSVMNAFINVGSKCDMLESVGKLQVDIALILDGRHRYEMFRCDRDQD